MMEDIHIADGIAAKLLLAGIVLVGAAVGAVGLASVTSQAPAVGVADEPVTAAFPINNVTGSTGAYQLSLDGKGNDPYPTAFSLDTVTAAFPIDNVTATQFSAGVLSDVSTVTQDMDPYALALDQDMDPY